jgi:hyperosmotically inducible periplasmic protein
MKTPAQTLRLSLLALATAVVLPAGLFANDVDDRIEKNFKDSYTYRTQLKDVDVSADAENGVVTLKGDVETTEQKALAEDTMRGIAGVTTVRNEIKVKSEPKESSDEWIALKVRSSLLYHRNVSLLDSDVSVANGNVTLTGTAETAAEKSLAGEYAADIKGVKNVDNKIMVVANADKERAEWKADKAHADMKNEKEHLKADKDRAVAKADAKYDDARRDMNRDVNRRDMGDKIDDASITAQVKGSLAISRSASAIRTEVTTREGVVTLRGEAKNSAEKELAGKIAKDIRGVRDVNNEITVVNKVAGE